MTALRYLSLGAVQQDAVKEQSEMTTAASVYEVARPVLQGCHAIPTKLKILLDRVLSALKQEEVLTIISGCGWQLDDYQRGYKLKVSIHSFSISVSHISGRLSLNCFSLAWPCSRPFSFNEKLATVFVTRPDKKCL